MEDALETIANKLQPETPPREGKLTKSIEEQTAKLPSMTWLWMAIGAGALSAGLASMNDRKDRANFVGLWVPSLLLIGVYNKLVKMEKRAFAH